MSFTKILAVMKMCKKVVARPGGVYLYYIGVVAGPGFLHVVGERIGFTAQFRVLLPWLLASGGPSKE
jgi:hypothetical protein